jgi:uncharacterized NAD-dependent epimerase/dehydratase family protein
VIRMTTELGRLTNPNIKAVGIAINTEALSEADALKTLQSVEAEHGLPTTDPIRFGTANIVDALQQGH